MSEEGKKEDKKERRFSQEQYEMLKRCSEKKDMTEWNEWRENNPDKEIWLEYAPLGNVYFSRANLQGANLGSVNLQGANFEEANLQGADLIRANLYRANFVQANLQDARLVHANLQSARLIEANLQDANFDSANLQDALLFKANLQGAKLTYANLQGVLLARAQLQGADSVEVKLQGAELAEAKLQGADFSRAIVDGDTLIWRCEVNRKTKFEGVGLDAARIYPDIKQLLEYNIRRINWEEWYKEHWFWRWPVEAFWAMSNYGMSTLRVIGVFFLLALLFAAVYMNWAYWAPPGIVSNLIVQPGVGEAAWHYLSRAVIRPVYFSVVTMTTLGFGDMYANKGSIAGHVLLILQVILGYVLLGALITRFAVLFTAGGPAGKFAEEKEK